MERVLADIDADHGDFAIEFLGHGVLLCPRCPSPAWPTGRAGARPDHPISGRRRSNSFALRDFLWRSALSSVSCARCCCAVDRAHGSAGRRHMRAAKVLG
jgi:hypothetical protein